MLYLRRKGRLLKKQQKRRSKRRKDFQRLNVKIPGRRGKNRTRVVHKKEVIGEGRKRVVAKNIGG